MEKEFLKKNDLDSYEKKMKDFMQEMVLDSYPISHPTVACAICKSTNVRVYRPIGFYVESFNRCNECLNQHPPESYQDPYTSYLPCIPTRDGEIWSNSAVPNDELKWWYSLPEKNPKRPIWDSYWNTWSDALTPNIHLPKEHRIGRDY